MKNSLPHCCRNGSVAILTLWTVLFLSAFALAMGGQVAADYQAANRFKRIVLDDAVAGRAFEDALAAIREDKTEGYDFLNEPWADDERFKNVSFNGVHYSITGDGKHYGLTDENRKININYAPAEVLSRLFQIVGRMSPNNAEETALYLVDWRDANIEKEGGKEDEPEYCAKPAKPYSCKNGNFENIFELWWLPNMSGEVFDRIRDKITLYGVGPSNINTADADALRCLGLSHGAASVIVGSREREPFKKLSQILDTSAGVDLGGEDRSVLEALISKGLIGVNSDVYRGRLVIDAAGKRKKTISFIFNRNGELKSWSE